VEEDVKCPRCFGWGSLWIADDKTPSEKCALCEGRRRVSTMIAVKWRLFATLPTSNTDHSKAWLNNTRTKLKEALDKEGLVD